MVLIWMVVIFMFSAKPADESSKESLFVGRMIGQIFMKDFGDGQRRNRKRLRRPSIIRFRPFMRQNMRSSESGSGKMQVSEKME